MGPHSDERGKTPEARRELALKMLQWGRTLMSAEKPIPDGMCVLHTCELQWGRTLMSAENGLYRISRWAIVSLQWGRTLMSAEKWGAATCGTARAGFNGAAL